MSDVQDVDVKDQQNLVPEKIYTPKRFQFDDKLDFDERPIVILNQLNVIIS